MKRIITSHDQLSVRHTNDRDVHLHHVVSRYGNHILKRQNWTMDVNFRHDRLKKNHPGIVKIVF